MAVWSTLFLEYWKREEVRQRAFPRHFILKVIVLPRQARDKHSKRALKKGVMRFPIGEEGGRVGPAEGRRPAPAAWLPCAARHRRARDDGGQHRKKARLLAPFYTETDRFPKTGSGQTQGKHSRTKFVSAGDGRAGAVLPTQTPHGQDGRVLRGRGRLDPRGGVLDVHVDGAERHHDGPGKKENAGFVLLRRSFLLQMITLPRQARDKHRES